MTSAYAKVSRYKEMISILLEEYEIKCHFCGNLLSGESLYRNKSGKSIDDLCWHHLDGHHLNNTKGNKRFAHRSCHLKYHRQMEKQERLRKYEEFLKNECKLLDTQPEMAVG